MDRELYSIEQARAMLGGIRRATGEHRARSHAVFTPPRKPVAGAGNVCVGDGSGGLAMG